MSDIRDTPATSPALGPAWWAIQLSEAVRHERERRANLLEFCAMVRGAGWDVTMETDGHCSYRLRAHLTEGKWDRTTAPERIVALIEAGRVARL